MQLTNKVYKLLIDKRDILYVESKFYYDSFTFIRNIKYYQNWEEIKEINNVLLSIDHVNNIHKYNIDCKL